MNKLSAILSIVLIAAIVGISGCTNADNQTNATNTQYSTNNATSNTSTPATTPSAAPKVQNTTTPINNNNVEYVGDVQTKVFHYSWCRYVSEMKDSNKVYFSTRDQAISAGYRPCKVCNP